MCCIIICLQVFLLLVANEKSPSGGNPASRIGRRGLREKQSLLKCIINFYITNLEDFGCPNIERFHWVHGTACLVRRFFQTHVRIIKYTVQALRELTLSQL